MAKTPVRLPTLDSRLIDDLSLLVKLQPEALASVVNVAVACLVSGAGDAEIAAVAASLSARPEKIRPIVLGLSSVFLEIAKARVPDDVFVQAISQLSLPPELSSVLLKVYD